MKTKRIYSFLYLQLLLSQRRSSFCFYWCNIPILLGALNFEVFRLLKCLLVQFAFSLSEPARKEWKRRKGRLFYHSDLINVKSWNLVSWTKIPWMHPDFRKFRVEKNNYGIAGRNGCKNHHNLPIWDNGPSVRSTWRIMEYGGCLTYTYYSSPSRSSNQ